VCRGVGEARAGPVAVHDDEAERGEHPEHHEDCPRIAVRDSTSSRPSRASSSPATQPSSVERVYPAGDPGQQQDRQRPDQRYGEPPAERRQPEQPLAGRDHDLAERRVRHQLALGAAQEVRAAADKQVVDVLDVVDLTPWRSIPQESGT